MNQTDRERIKRNGKNFANTRQQIGNRGDLEHAYVTGALDELTVADKQLEELKQEQIETAQRIDASQDMHEKELEELRAELDELRAFKKERLLEQAAFDEETKVFDEKFKNIEDTNEYLRSEGIDPEELASQGVVFVTTVMEKIKLEKENGELKAELEKKEIQLSSYAYEIDRAKRDRDNAEAAKRDLLNSLDNLFTHNLNRETSKAIRELIKKYQ